MKKWILKTQALKKFYLRHPWIFSNDLGHSPKGLNAGELVEVYNESGDFLARGYGHPNTLICFRELTRDANQNIDFDLFYFKFVRAYEKRCLAKIEMHSFRLIFAEADYLPGLIIDRYKLVGENQVFVIQASTAGIDLLLPEVQLGLEKFVRGHLSISWEKTAIIFANDSKSRLLEGLKIEAKCVVKEIPNFDWNEIEIEIASAMKDLLPLKMNVDLIGGQKTGFFLDQRSNIELVVLACSELFKRKHKQRLRILDLCCYNGQWSAQLARLFSKTAIECEFTCLDASEKALSLAKNNLLKQGVSESSIYLKKLDVLKELSQLPDQSYDIVICDPPAFIKKKQDIPNGERAYLKLNRDAIKKTASGGLYMSCSCSGHLDDLKFREMLVHATSKAGRRLEWFSRGSHSPDHPELPEFSQGTYLKSWLGWMQ